MPQSALVERHEQLGSLQALLSEAAKGRGAMVFVGGEAGIGKSALVQRFCGDAAASCRVLTGGSASARTRLLRPPASRRSRCSRVCPRGPRWRARTATRPPCACSTATPTPPSTGGSAPSISRRPSVTRVSSRVRTVRWRLRSSSKGDATTWRTSSAPSSWLESTASTCCTRTPTATAAPEPASCTASTRPSATCACRCRSPSSTTWSRRRRTPSRGSA
ncbi:MAG: ATP-binding protein [Trueperaceae bacterium]|nr:ATP-binding protein [Trueperaceae bacterium]